MTIIEKLSDLGFDAADLSTKSGKTLVKVKTDKGWAYERFENVQQVEIWAKGRKPEVKP
jgi:hypothetical protein